VAAWYVVSPIVSQIPPRGRCAGGCPDGPRRGLAVRQPARRAPRAQPRRLARHGDPRHAAHLLPVAHPDAAPPSAPAASDLHPVAARHPRAGGRRSLRQLRGAGRRLELPPPRRDAARGQPLRLAVHRRAFARPAGPPAGARAGIPSRRTAARAPRHARDGRGRALHRPAAHGARRAAPGRLDRAHGRRLTHAPTCDPRPHQELHAPHAPAAPAPRPGAHRHNGYGPRCARALACSRTGPARRPAAAVTAAVAALLAIRVLALAIRAVGPTAS
jgi:hypothetical protein